MTKISQKKLTVILIAFLFVISVIALFVNIDNAIAADKKDIKGGWLVPKGTLTESSGTQTFKGAWAIDNRGLYVENITFSFKVPDSVAIGETSQIAFQSDKKQISSFNIGKIFTITRVEDGVKLQFGENEVGKESNLLDYSTILNVDKQYHIVLEYSSEQYTLYLDGVDISSDCTTLFATLQKSDISDAYQKSYIAIKQSSNAVLELVDYGQIYNMYYDYPADIIKVTAETEIEYLAQNRYWQGCPTIQEVDGRIWAGWFTGGVKEPSILNYSVLAYSDDGGDTWTDPAYIVKLNGYGRAGDVQFWVDPQGNFWMFWVQHGGHVFETNWGVWGVKITNAGIGQDAVFGEPIRICDGLLRNRLTVLDNGDWLLGAYDQNDADDTKVYASIDNGQTWTLRGSAKTSDESGSKNFATYFDEQMIVELEPNHLWMLIRTDEKDENGQCYIAQSHSYDGGYTWSRAVDSGLRGPSSRFFFYKLKDGNVLLINHKSGSGRGELLARIFYTSTQTWTSEDTSFSIDDRANISYPDAYFDANEENITLIYDRERYQAREVIMTTFSVDDIYGGKVDASVNPAILNRKVISKATIATINSEWPGIVTTDDRLDGTTFMYANARYTKSLQSDYVKAEIDILDLYHTGTWIAVGLSGNANAGIDAGKITSKTGTNYLSLLFRNKNGELDARAFNKGIETKLVAEDDAFVDALGKMKIEFVRDDVNNGYVVYINDVKMSNSLSAFSGVTNEMISDVNGKTYLSFAAMSPTTNVVRDMAYRGWIVEKVIDIFAINVQDVKTRLQALKDKQDYKISDKSMLESLRQDYNYLDLVSQDMLTEIIYLINAENVVKGLEDEIKVVEELIDLLAIVSELTISDKDTYYNANNAFNNLTAEQKMLVDQIKKDKLADCTVKMEEVFQPIYDVEDLIDSLPNIIVYADKDLVENVKAEYDKLALEYKNEVRNLYKLNSALSIISRMQEVIDIDADIAVLPVNLTIDNKAEVLALLDRYNNLTEQEQGQINNYYKLVSANLIINAMTDEQNNKSEIDSVIDKINQIHSNGVIDLNKLQVANTAYDKLTDNQKLLVTNFSLLKAANAITNR